MEFGQSWSQVLTDEEEALERYKVVIHAMQDVDTRRSEKLCLFGCLFDIQRHVMDMCLDFFFGV